MIRIDKITHGYTNLGGEKRILYREASLVARDGELMAILGRNGVGKSTLLKSIAGLHSNIAGDIFINDLSISKMSNSELASLVSFVSTERIKVVNLSVWNVVSLGRAPYTNWIGKLSPSDKRIVEQAIEQVGMSGFINKNINTLSDGERQRVMIARALAQDTPVILLDEPTAFLDIPNKYETVLLLQTLAHQQNKTILFSTHDLNIALHLADSVCVISDGEFAVGKPREMVENGAIGAMFKGTSISYDQYRGDAEF